MSSHLLVIRLFKTFIKRIFFRYVKEVDPRASWLVLNIHFPFSDLLVTHLNIFVCIPTDERCRKRKEEHHWDPYIPEDHELAVVPSKKVARIL
eukprot:2454060-Amphidinium_carterae.6